MYQKVKEHVLRHKVAYSVGSIVVIAGVAYYFGTRAGSTHMLSPSIRGNFNKLDQRVITIVERPGPPSWVVGKTGTDLTWDSQRAAAAAEGIRVSDLRAHLNGLTDNINGDQYFRKGLAVV